MARSEQKEFEGVLKRAKEIGLSKKKVLEATGQIRAKGKMMWMLTPITSPKSKLLERDVQKTYRLERYINNNWSKRKLKKVM